MDPRPPYICYDCKANLKVAKAEPHSGITMMRLDDINAVKRSDGSISQFIASVGAYDELRGKPDNIAISSGSLTNLMAMLAKLGVDIQ